MAEGFGPTLNVPATVLKQNKLMRLGGKNLSDQGLNRIHEAIGALTNEVVGLRRDAGEDRSISANHRKEVRDELTKLVVRTTHLEADLMSVKKRVEDNESVTVEVRTLRNKAQGAGTLGRWLIRVGIGLVGFVGWAIGIWTYLTGRPPP